MYYFSAPNTIKVNITSFHLVQDFLFPFVHPTIQNLRIERLFLGLIASLSITFSGIYFIKHFFNETLTNQLKFLLFGLIFSSFSLTYACFSPTLSYNSFSYLLINFGLAFFLIDISKPHSYKVVFIIYSLIGTIISLLFLVKAPNAILLFISFITIIFINEYSFTNHLKNSLLKIIYRALFILVSFLIIQIIIWNGFNHFISYLKEYVGIISTTSNHSITDFKRIYTDSISYFFKLLLLKKNIYLIISCFLCVLSIHKEFKKLFYISISIQVFLVIRYNIYLGGEANKFEQTVIYIIWMMMFLLFYLKENWTQLLQKNCRKPLTVFFLAFLPLIGILGTSNYLHLQLIFYLTPWFLLFFILTINTKSHLTKHLVLLGFTVLGFYQSYNAIIYHPYRINSNLFNQTELLRLKNDDSILVEKQTKNEIDKIKLLLAKSGYIKGDYIFTYSSMIGLSYIYDSQTPTKNTCWFDSSDEKNNCKIVTDFFKQKDKVKLFFILDNRQLFSPFFKECLAQSGYYFDKDFYNAGSVDVHFCNENYRVTVFSPVN